jgi:hypothetical protein
LGSAAYCRRLFSVCGDEGSQHPLGLRRQGQGYCQPGQAHFHLMLQCIN